MGDLKPIRTCGTWAIKQRMNHEGFGASGWFFDPERAEIGEFFTVRRSRINCKTARRQAVNITCSNGTEIACALEDGELLIYALLLKLSPKP